MEVTGDTLERPRQSQIYLQNNGISSNVGEMQALRADYEPT